jgi:hypothetical protein
MLRHHLQHLREIHQRDKCRIESLLLRGIRERSASQAGVLLQPVVDVQDFLRVGGRGCDLSQQGVRIKSDWGQELIQLVRRRNVRLRVEKRPELLGNHQSDQQ